MPRIRVLRVIARMNVGGPALQVVGLTRGLQTDEFETLLLTGSVGPEEADHLELRAPDVPVRRVGGLGRAVRPGDDLRALREITAAIRSFRPDILHSHTAKAGALGRLAAIATGVPHRVHTYHGHLLHGYFSAPVTAAMSKVEALLARRTSRLVAVGRQVRDDLLAAGIGKPEQYVVVPPGIEVEPPPPRDEARRALGVPLDVPIIGFVARLTPVKRPDRALEAFEKLLQEQPDAHMIIAGDGPLGEEVRVRAGRFRGQMHLLGWRSDVSTVYSACDVALLTSDNEGMPVSLIEAAMCGVPAVTTAVGSAAEVVLDGRTGTVVEPRAEDLAEGTLRLLQDHALRHRLGEAAREVAVERFGVERLVRDTAELYRSLVRW